MTIVWIDIIGIIILIAGIILVSTGKLKSIETLTTVVLLTVFPLLIFGISVIFNYLVLNEILKDKPNFYNVISICILILEIVVFSLVIILKFNILPYSALIKDKSVQKKFVMIDRARKLLKIAIYSNLINIAYLLILVFIISKIGTYVKLIHYLFLSLPGAVVILLPIEAYISIIIATNIVIIISLTYIFTINGTIRLLISSKHIRKNAITYIVLMLIPTANLVCSIILSHKAKKELENEGYRVGIFRSIFMKVMPNNESLESIR